MDPEPLKQCQCCTARAPVAALTCAACGEGTWLALPPAEPTGDLPPDAPSGDLPQTFGDRVDAIRPALEAPETSPASPQAKRKKT